MSVTDLQMWGPGSQLLLALIKTMCHAPTRRWKVSDDMYIRLGTIPDCDGRTDRQKDGFSNTISRSACNNCCVIKNNNAKNILCLHLQYGVHH